MQTSPGPQLNPFLELCMYTGFPSTHCLPHKNTQIPQNLCCGMDRFQTYMASLDLGKLCRPDICGNFLGEKGLHCHAVIDYTA
jgi:hypothetical protein